MAFLISVTAISIDAMLPALGLISADLEILIPNQRQYIVSFVFIGITVGQLFCGPLSDSFGRKKILYISIFIYFLGSVVCFFASNIEVMLLGRLIQGVGASGPYVLSVSIVRDKLKGRAMAKAMSLIMMVFVAVPAIAPTIGQAVISISSWRYIFVLYILYAFTIIIWIFFRLEETLLIEKRVKFSPLIIARNIKSIILNRKIFEYIVCSGCAFAILISYISLSQQIFQIQFNSGNSFVLYFALMALFFAASSFINSYLVEKLGMGNLCMKAMISLVVISFIFGAYLFLFDIKFWNFIVYSGLLFFCFGFIFGNLNALAMEKVGYIAGSASAVIGSLSSAVGIIFAITTGVLYNGKLDYIIASFLILSVLSLVFLFHALKDR